VHPDTVRRTRHELEEAGVIPFLAHRHSKARPEPAQEHPSEPRALPLQSGASGLSELSGALSALSAEPAGISKN
jgi:hypothetical protein